MDHPYKGFEGSDLWAAIEKSLKLLQENGDIKTITCPEYVIGFLCNSLTPLVNNHPK